MLPGSDSGTTERVKGCRFRVSSFGSCPCLIASPSQSWRNSLMGKDCGGRRVGLFGPLCRNCARQGGLRGVCRAGGV